MLLYEELTYKIRGIFFEVYNNLGPGFKESIYHKALEKEFINNDLPYESEKVVSINYKGDKVGVYKPDFVVDDKVVIEIKSVSEIPAIFERQLFSYLKATGYMLGFLVNFGSNKLDIRRRILTNARIDADRGADMHG